MLQATISADIIASSSLTSNEIDKLTKFGYHLFDVLNEYHKNNKLDKLNIRLTQGDLIECLLQNPQDALRVALIIKTGIKSFRLEKKADTKYRKAFETYGIRVAIGLGNMDMNLVEKDILKGDAINRSGRMIADQKTSNKERLVVKNTLFFDSPSAEHNKIFTPIMSLLDVILNRLTRRQSEVIFWRLLGYNENETSKQLKITQSSVNQQSRTSGWSAIEESIALFSSFNFNTTP